MAEEVRRLPTGAPLPNWTHLTPGERLTIALQLIPAGERVAVLKKSEKQLARYAAGTEIPLQVVAALAVATEIPLDWIVHGRAMERKPPVIFVAPGGPAPTDGAVPIQKLAFRASAGPGAMVVDDAAEHVHVPRAILDHAGVRPEQARLWEALGDSMSPTINDGDLLLVDIASTAIAEGKVYVFSIGDEVFVKRLRSTGRGVLIRADNRELYPEEEAVPTDLPFRIYGRVKWAGRNL